MRWAFVLALLSACGANVSGGTGESCSGDETRCVGDSFQVCQGGEFYFSETCGGTLQCVEDFGCAECDPVKDATACREGDVYSCNPDGSSGGLVQSCGGSGCSGGVCISDCGGDGSDLIFLVDTDFNLWRFDPREVSGQPFTSVGKLSCPAGPSLDGYGEPGQPATPFSMSVDRNGRAWVLYSSGEIFWVSTKDASCQASWWIPGTKGFELFGMGFASDSAGSSSETLFIAGGSASNLSGGDLGSVDPVSQAVSVIAPLPNAENSPEMTGTGEGKLYGYYPGLFETFVVNIEKTSAQHGAENYPLPPVDGLVSAWAFAHWGGEFYIFVSVAGLLGGETHSVVHLDPASGNAQTVIQNHGHEIVGAGVSTCAPVDPVD